MAAVEQNPAAEGGPALRGSGTTLLDRAESAIYRCEALLAGASLAVILAAIIVSIVTRQLNLPLPNAGELAIVAMCPLTFVGAALCTYLNAHIGVELAQSLSSSLLRKLAHAASLLSQCIFAAVFGYVAWEFFAYAAESGENLIDLGTPVAVPAGFMVAGSALMAFHAAADLYRLAAGLPHPRRSA